VSSELRPSADRRSDVADVAERPRPRTSRAGPSPAGRPRGPSLLLRYGVTSLLLFLALGSVLGHLLQRSIEERVVDSTLRETQLITRLGVQRVLLPEELQQGLDPDRIRALDRVLMVTLSPLDVVEVAVWNAEGRWIYTRDREVIGTLAEPSGPLTTALRGEPAAAVADVSEARDLGVRRHGEVLEAYLPLQLGYGRDVPVEGVVRTTLPYEPIRETIRAHNRRLYLVLAGGLAALYGVLFRLVAGASRALRHQAALNEHQALHDALTDLPNRSLFQDRLHHAVAAAERTDEPFAVALMDLDRFKEINDTLGHHHGDLLLREVANRLRGTLRAVDTVARLGGDEFAFLLHGVANEAAAKEVAEKLHASLEQPFDVLGTPLEIEASLGVALYPSDADDPATLLQRADVAMYAAKRAHLGCAFYDATLDGHSRDRLTLTSELRRAIERDELVVHYQPKHDLTTGGVTGMEALVRWEHPTRGLLLPGDFIPLAEHSDLIRPLTRTVLDLALRDCRRWNDAGHGIGVAVNLSVRNLQHDDLVSTVESALARHSVDPGQLTLELTETTIAADPDRARRVVLELRDLGVRLAIDDFGTGYSSLSLLRDLSVHELKIDRSFVADLAGGNDASAIVGFSCDLGHRLGLTVVAEGVETDAVEAELRLLGCDVAQGYLFSPPLPVDLLLGHLRSRAADQVVGSTSAGSTTP
jgi:diguanylate cyclase (GGDEF)-like protein